MRKGVFIYLQSIILFIALTGCTFTISDDEDSSSSSKTMVSHMVKINVSDPILFPSGVNNDSVEGVDRSFKLAKYEVTNNLFIKALNWAMEEERLVDADFEFPAGGSTWSDVKMNGGGPVIASIDGPPDFTGCYKNHIGFNKEEKRFYLLNSDYGDHPVINITWYGAIQVCNWLTEMEDGSTDNLVYSNISSHSTIVVDHSRTGYRLPSSYEWEFVARYRGKTVPTSGTIADDYITRGKDGNYNGITEGYIWTPANYASGATEPLTDLTDTAAWSAYGWLNATTNDSNYYGEGEETKRVGSYSANKLGLYDMSGNVFEFTDTPISSGIYNIVGGSWSASLGIDAMGVYSTNRQLDISSDEWGSMSPKYGFRIARTVAP